MINIIIAVIFVIIGIIIFNAVKEGAAYSGVKKFFAVLGALSPIIAILYVLFWENIMVLNDYKYIREEAAIINQEIKSARLDNNIPSEVIEKAEKHNKNCKQHYDKFQSSLKWSLLGKFRKSTLEYQVDIPQENVQETIVTTDEVPTYQTTIINGTEYELVPKGE